MTEKMTEQLADALELCLVNLEAGMTMEETLEKVPEHAAEIRPLLETAVIAQSEASTDVPAAVMQRSRTRMLVRAQQLRTQMGGKHARRIPWLRLALQVLGVVVVLASSLTSLFVASAGTVPGDNLYGIKRFGEEARLTIASPAARTKLQSVYRERRIDEIKELLQMRRATPVMFEGVVTQMSADLWVVGGLEVTITPNTNVNGKIWPGMFVEVQGQTTVEGEIRAVTVYLRAYAFMGTVDAIDGQSWTVNGVPVLITAGTQLAPGITLGTPVVVLAQVDDTGAISARAVLLADGTSGFEDGTPGLLTGSETPTPSPTPSPTSSAAPSGTLLPTEDDFEFDPTEEDNSGPGSGGEPTETEEPDETDEPDETESPEPTETEEEEEGSNSGSGSASNTPEPSRTPKPSETPKPTKTPDD